jgi:hypothetical protein
VEAEMGRLKIFIFLLVVGEVFAESKIVVKNEARNCKDEIIQGILNIFGVNSRLSFIKISPHYHFPANRMDIQLCSPTPSTMT